MCVSLGQLARNPGCITAHEVFSQVFIPRLLTVNQRTEQNLFPHTPAVARFLWFHWSLVGSLGAVCRHRRLIQLLLSWLQALIFVVVLGWIFVPIYVKAGVSQTTTSHLSAAHVCRPGLECCEVIRKGTRSECARAALCCICVLEKWGFSVLWSELRSTWCSLLVLLWFLELLFPETPIAAPLILCSTHTVSEYQKSSSSLICSPLSKTFSTSTGGDNARVPEEAFWWETDPGLPVNPFPDPVCFHKDLSKSNFYSISSILHWSKEKKCHFQYCSHNYLAISGLELLAELTTVKVWFCVFFILYCNPRVFFSGVVSWCLLCFVLFLKF